ncbi:hypothetical protein ITP53_51110 [Nonomuraea sp. K274]|uniref:Uncharacterized protein n=1 Tax=Nonomuraea cypriaca TaxID=1187855 RepID=A0A931ANL3_9ACTN|nr:hypothetical protein [Nonomuraea cypriaca]MBF8193893.1 hypothetical protein [Nonomuraea cypriaca]
MARPEDDVLYLGTTIENGISQWDTMANALAGQWPAVSAELKAVHAAAPWGDGAEGRAFAHEYMKLDGPNRLIETGTELVGHIADAGPRLHTTIANSRSTDTGIAADLARGQGTREV